MPSPLKVFRAHLGFYDSVVAAPSQKAALEAWGAGKSEFAHGFAEVTQDAKAVAAALAQPGVVLRRPFGSGADFKSQPDAPLAPKPTVNQKRAGEDVARERKRKAVAEAKAKKAAEALRKKQVAQEIEAIETEEARLRARRQALKKKLPARSV